MYLFNLFVLVSSLMLLTLCSYIFFFKLSYTLIDALAEFPLCYQLNAINRKRQ